MTQAEGIMQQAVVNFVFRKAQTDQCFYSIDFQLIVLLLNVPASRE